MGDLKTSGDPGKPPHPTTDSMVEWLAWEPLGHSLPSMCTKDATSLRLSFLPQKMEIPVLTSRGCCRTLGDKMCAKHPALAKCLITARCCYCYWQVGVQGSQK